MKPFDLEKALAGQDVVTMDGLDVDEIHLFKNGIIGVLILDQIYVYDKNGRIISSPHIEEKDLMMDPTKKRGWINVYPEEKSVTLFGMPIISKAFPSKEIALSNAQEGSIQVEIEWEE